MSVVVQGPLPARARSSPFSPFRLLFQLTRRRSPRIRCLRRRGSEETLLSRLLFLLFEQLVRLSAGGPGGNAPVFPLVPQEVFRRILGLPHPKSSFLLLAKKGCPLFARRIRFAFPFQGHPPRTRDLLPHPPLFPILPPCDPFNSTNFLPGCEEKRVRFFFRPPEPRLAKKMKLSPPMTQPSAPPFLVRSIQYLLSLLRACPL